MSAHDWQAAGVALWVVLFVAGVLWACHLEDQRLAKPLPGQPPAENSATGPESSPTPIPMVLHCPACGLQHLDAPKPCSAEFCEGGCVQPLDCTAWTNPPHRSHLCQYCGHTWRPADVPTTGVHAVTTRGKLDSPLVCRICGDEKPCYCNLPGGV